MTYTVCTLSVHCPTHSDSVYVTKCYIVTLSSLSLLTISTLFFHWFYDGALPYFVYIHYIALCPSFPIPTVHSSYGAFHLLDAVSLFVVVFTLYIHIILSLDHTVYVSSSGVDDGNCECSMQNPC